MKKIILYLILTYLLSTINSGAVKQNSNENNLENEKILKHFSFSTSLVVTSWHTAPRGLFVGGAGPYGFEQCGLWRLHTAPRLAEGVQVCGCHVYWRQTVVCVV